MLLNAVRLVPEYIRRLAALGLFARPKGERAQVTSLAGSVRAYDTPVAGAGDMDGDQDLKHREALATRPSYCKDANVVEVLIPCPCSCLGAGVWGPTDGAGRFPSALKNL